MIGTKGLLKEAETKAAERYRVVASCIDWFALNTFCMIPLKDCKPGDICSENGQMELDEHVRENVPDSVEVKY